MKYYVYAFVSNPFKVDDVIYREVFRTNDYITIEAFMKTNWSGFSYTIVNKINNTKVYHFE